MPGKRKQVATNGGSGGKQAKLTNFVTVTEGKKKAPPAPCADDKTEIKLLDFLTEPSWRKALRAELEKPYVKEIETFLSKQYAAGKQIFPPRHLIFNAFNSVPISSVRVVILGQDPYHDVGQAHGLCFSVQKGVRSPPSLKNIFKELSSDIGGFSIPSHGCLQAWADQGIFLPNATLTVEAHKANSHAGIGWQKLTDAAIRAVSESVPHAVFILWGGFAHKKAPLIDAAKHTVIKDVKLKNAHPSPLSATKFFGCKCFSQTNAALVRYGLEPIAWQI